MYLRTFLELKKNLKKDMANFTLHKIALLGDSATQNLSAAIKGYALEAGYNFDIYEADYNQIDLQLMDQSSETYSFNPQSILIYMCSEKLHETFCSTTFEDRESFAEVMYAKISNYWSLINQHTATNILQFNFVNNHDGIFGNYALKTVSSFDYQLQKLNYLLSEESQKFKNIYLIDLNALQSKVGRSSFYDDKLYYIAKMAMTTDVLPMIAKSVVDVVKVLDGKIKKCVVLDLDNTLWGGVIGDDGLEGIQIGELGIGYAYTEFQMWLKELKNRGIILTICSKNNEDTAKDPFLKHPEMVLKLEDISMFVANWEDKATNIKHIQQTLNIGMDSIVFLDDNPFERNLVKSMIPEITVPELPEDPAYYLNYIKSLNLFETVSFSQEDQDRTRQYQAEASRTVLKQRFTSIDNYFENLKMKATVLPFDKFHYPRIAQLTQRSNQFNLRTIRYSEAEIEKIAENDCYVTLSFCLKDKFGDHGLISVVILEKQEETLFVNEWIMSCRVLKRSMEEFIINKVIGIARANGFKKVIGEYIKTSKNAMVERIYEKMGFHEIGEGKFAVDVNRFEELKTYIYE